MSETGAAPSAVPSAGPPAGSPSRVVLAESGGVDGGGKVGVDSGGLARELRDAGHELVWVGASGPERLAAVAVQEDADLAILLAPEEECDGLARALRAALVEHGAADIGVQVSCVTSCPRPSSAAHGQD